MQALPRERQQVAIWLTRKMARPRAYTGRGQAGREEDVADLVPRGRRRHGAAPVLSSSSSSSTASSSSSSVAVADDGGVGDDNRYQFFI